MENCIIIDISKNFTIDEAAKFRLKVNKDIESGNINFLLDFSGCDFIDSTGLGVIVSAYKKCVEHNGNIKLKGLKEPVRKLFSLTRLDKVFEIYP
ncbi:MAG: STAS domain-containing protein [Bacillota bacterium]|nr:STAS domain-containing protein [Bacillota bacterium]